MKYLYSILVTGLLFLVLSRANKYNFFPNLPTGKFKLYFVALFKCNKSQDYLLDFNYHFHKTSTNTSEVRGHTTLKVPVDDSHILNINMAVKDSIGGWKDNAIIYKLHNACTFIQKEGGTESQHCLKRMGINTTDKCPIPAGHYISKGYDLSRLPLMANFPNIFFYGTYKTSIYITDRYNKIYGCLICVLDVLRPWEDGFNHLS